MRLNLGRETKVPDKREREREGGEEVGRIAGRISRCRLFMFINVPYVRLSVLVVSLSFLAG